MRETKIKLTLEDVEAFVRAATSCDFDVDVNYNRVLVDAKSILGVLSLDLGQTLTVKCHGEDEGFESFLEKYKIA
ncbi:MAG: HPr family phosphocarrier protein [Eubacteriales bacterium]|nr:HPr family phosphocarrier protein [Eubacteriales bacterium]